MTSVFKSIVFPEYVSSGVMKSHMEGFDDPALPSFSLLNVSAIMKKEFKHEELEGEFIKSYLNAAKVLVEECAKFNENNAGRGIYALTEYSYTLPVLYLTRHCMELAIKRAIRKCGYEPKKVHGLHSLWSSFCSRLQTYKTDSDAKTIGEMGKFVDAIVAVDDNGVDLRYSEDREGNLTQDKVLFVNNKEIVHYLECFVEQLEAFDFSAIKSGVQ